MIIITPIKYNMAEQEKTDPIKYATKLYLIVLNSIQNGTEIKRTIARVIGITNHIAAAITSKAIDNCLSLC